MIWRPALLVVLAVVCTASADPLAELFTETTHAITALAPR